jgi:hypothetical protein
MRSLTLMIATIMLFNTSSSFAQVGSTAPRNASAINMTLPMSTRSVIPPIGATVATPLGAIQFNLGVLGPNSGSPIGTITTCSTTGVAVPSTTLDASNSVGATGMLPPQLPPGASPSAVSSFGTSVMTGGCNPTAAALEATESSGSSVASPIPGLATIAGPAFSDATIPSAATEAGGAGLSPEIVVPTPDSSAGP